MVSVASVGFHEVGFSSCLVVVFGHYKEFVNIRLDLDLIFSHNYHMQLAIVPSHLGQGRKILVTKDNTWHQVAKAVI